VIRQLTTGYKLFESEWHGKDSTIVMGRDLQRNELLMDIGESLRLDTKRLNRIIREFDRRDVAYTADEVIAEFRRISQDCTLFNFMQSLIVQLRKCGRLRTGDTYQSALNSFREYRNGKDIIFDVITSDVIQLYEASMLNRGVCANTTSFYIRILRSVYNRAVEQGLTEQNHPFKSVFTGVCKTVKRAVTLDDIKRIKSLDLSSNTGLSLARDLFMFSFYTRGMSFVDMVYLRRNCVRGGVIIYHRRKTGQLLSIKVEECMQEIIERYHNPDSEYVFPILKTAGQEYREYRNALRLVNVKLKEIGELIGLPIRLTTYVGRHSWGSAAKTNNIPISVISESMGHHSEAMTQIYLASLDTSVIDQANAKILKKVL
jgi:integrase